MRSTWLTLIFLGGFASRLCAAPIDFAKDIKPIFESRCVSCHGEKKQKNGLRLDHGPSALKGGESGMTIVPGKPNESLLLRRVVTAKAADRMPPEGDPLTHQQIQLLRTWITEGAKWPASADSVKVADQRDWWSFKPIVRPAVPQLHDPNFPIRNPIDAFILAKLREKGLSPSTEAERRTLIRRVYFDLIGLPPTPEAIAQFVNDPDPQAYEKLVDRLLASSGYGERWARHWLDIVHYGDTHGYDKDKPRPNAWPYRDYVIRALNDDKPYSRFVKEQIAGDVLYPNTLDGVTATGFLAAGPWDFIGHAEVPETKIDGKIARLLDRDDMVSNTFNTFTSLTVQCARCHHHKFDPVTQEDYYRLHAVFAAIDRADRSYDADPTTSAKRAALEQQRRDLSAKKQLLDAEISKVGGAALVVLDRKIAEALKPDTSPKSVAFGYHSSIEPAADRAKWVQLDLGKSQTIETVIYVGCHDNFNNIGAGFGFPVRYRVELSNDPKFEKEVLLLLDATKADVVNPGVVPQEIKVGGKQGRYLRFTATKLALRQNDYIFALAEMLVHDKSGKNLAEGATITALDSIEAAPRWRKQNLVDGYYFGVGSGDSLAKLKQQREELLAKVIDAETREKLISTTAELAKVEKSLAALPMGGRVYAGTVYSGSGTFAGTGGKPRTIHVLHRGDVRSPGKEVGPGTVPLLVKETGTFELPRDHSEGQRRAALAEWITDPHHPLTWRSIVNRVWQYHFGRGIVDSPNDFGRMGQMPSHPELLDWLADEFRTSDQSLKRLHRMMVLSSTYRQSSSHREDQAKIDSGNVHLWRMNRRKLEAEAVRDSVLAVSGKLDHRMGGPGYQDFIVEKPEHSPHYQYHLHDPEKAETHRRSIYRFIVRSQPQPFLTTLDCADPSISVDKRNETLTALQALACMNNRFVIAMAKHCAAKIEREATTPEDQVTQLFLVALGRQPTKQEHLAVLDYRKQFGLANACRAVMNLNEFAFVD